MLVSKPMFWLQIGYLFLKKGYFCGQAIPFGPHNKNNQKKNVIRRREKKCLFIVFCTGVVKTKIKNKNFLHKASS